MSEEKEIRADAKLKNLGDEDLEQLWGFRYPEDPEEKLTFAQIQGEVPLRFGFTVSLSTLSEFYSWLKQRRRMDAARSRAEQAKQRFLQSNPDASVEELERLGQMMFTSETTADGNIQGFVALMRANNTKRKLRIEERRIKLLEEKARKAEEAKAALEEQKASGGLSAETMELIERTLGML